MDTIGILVSAFTSSEDLSFSSKFTSSRNVCKDEDASCMFTKPLLKPYVSLVVGFVTQVVGANLVNYIPAHNPHCILAFNLRIVDYKL